LRNLDIDEKLPAWTEAPQSLACLIRKMKKKQVAEIA
jgi:hypothetical protein